MTSSVNSAVWSKLVGDTKACVPANTPPPKAARPEPSTNSSSLRRRTPTPTACAAPASDPIRASSSPTPDRMIRPQTNTQTPSRTAATAPDQIVVEAADAPLMMLGTPPKPTEPPT